MCEPVTLATIGAASGVAGTLMKISAAQGRSAFMQGQAGRAANMAEQAASDALARAGLTGMRALLHGGQVVAEQRAQLSTSGADINTGSSGDVQRSTRLFSQMDEEIIRLNASREAYALRAKAQGFRQEGEFARTEGENEVISSIIGGIGSVAGGIGKSWLDVPSKAPPDLRPLETDFDERGF